MKSKIRRRVIVSVAVLAVVAAAGVAAFWGPAGTEPAPNNAAAAVSEAELDAAAGRRVFFGHMSVGENIVGGLEQLYQSKGVARLQVVAIEPGASGSQVPESGALAHALIGANGDPQGKLASFDAMLRAGLADQVDVALVKFCYVDVTQETDVDALFGSYQATLEALAKDYPEVRFLHVTVPLTTQPSGIKQNLKALLEGSDNPNRERYNSLLRAAYGPDQVFDVAAVEGTAPDGTRQPSLYPGYSSDGAHLNDSGSALVAAELVRLLAAGERE